MEARNYELLLSTVFGSNSTSQGVDSEMYLMMTDAHQNIFSRSYFETHEERIMEFRRTFLVIREQVLEALTETSKLILARGASQSELNLMYDLSSKFEGSFFDKSVLDQVVTHSLTVLAKYGVSNLNRMPLNVQAVYNRKTMYTN